MGAHKKGATRRRAHIVFEDESGFSLLPLVRRTWAPRGHTPLLHRAGRYRDKISALSALTVSPVRRRLRLFTRFVPKRSLKGPDIVAFLRQLLRHLRGHVIVVWDRGRQHRALVTQEFVARHRRRLSIEWLPAYAPELNPDEHVWSLLKYHRLANHGYRDVGLLHRRLHYHVGRVRREQDLLWACIEASELSLGRPHSRH